MLNLPTGRNWVVMGILNVTPDSFYDGGKYTDNLLKRIAQMVSEGVDIIDVGGESTRPGSASVSAQQELDRVLPAIETISTEFDVIISVDTSKAAVARQSVSAGAHWINDVSAGRNDADMAKTVASLETPVVLMHSRKTPETMQINPYYDDVVSEVFTELEESVALFVNSGVKKENIILDPGIGFAKRLEDNLRLLNECERFSELYPLLIGTSRKSFIGTVTGKEVAERLAGSLATVGVTYNKGARIFRVHDVAATVDYLKMIDAIHGN